MVVVEQVVAVVPGDCLEDDAMLPEKVEHVMQSTAADNEDCGFVLVEADAAMDVATSPPAPSPSASPSGSSGHASGYCSVTPGSASPASALSCCVFQHAT